MLFQVKPIATKTATTLDDPIISDPNRRGVWIDQGDGTSLRAAHSAIADGFTSDVLSTSGLSWLRR
jgi:hypothetical protein